jgi:uncharacterized protein (DUF1684 family)
MRKLAACFFFALIFAAAASPSPVATWKAEIAADNKHFANDAHAILKIQDAAYLREGDNSTLVGTKGKPESYHWVKGANVKGGVLFAGVRRAHAFVVMDKHLYSEAEIAKGISVDTDVDVLGQPTQVGAGIIGARLWVYNQKSQAAKTFTGLIYYPYDPSYIVTANFTPDPKRPARVFRTSRGTDKQFYHAGDATFLLKGKSFTLPFFTDSDDPADMKILTAFFTDNLTGKETYGAGRYVDIQGFGPFPPKKVTIDFNYAYNPNCARSAFYTCPFAVDILALDLRAGERDPHHAH